MNKISQVIMKIYNEQVIWEARENHNCFSAEHYEELIKKYYSEIQNEISFESFRQKVWNDFDRAMNQEKAMKDLEKKNLNAVIENYSRGFLDFETAINLQKEIHEAVAQAASFFFFLYINQDLMVNRVQNKRKIKTSLFFFTKILLF